MASALVSALALAACRGDTSGPPDLGCTPRWYRVDHVTLPDGSSDAPLRLGLDLDGDGQFDNWFGESLYIVREVNPDIQPLSGPASARLWRGDPVWRIAIDECADDVARVDLSNDGRPFTVSAATGHVTGTGGRGDVPISVLADPLGTYEPIAWLPVIGAAVDLEVTRDELSGRIGFAMPVPASLQDLLAPFAAYVTSELPGGTSEYAKECDSNHDGVCTVDELLGACNPDLFGGCSSEAKTLTEPDLTIDGMPALSYGLAIHATLEN
jgi:hypothetical protein